MSVSCDSPEKSVAGHQVNPVPGSQVKLTLKCFRIVVNCFNFIQPLTKLLVVKQTMLILILIGLFLSRSNGQNAAIIRSIDSLKIKINNTSADTTRIRLLNDVAEKFQSISMDSCFKYATIALTLSDSLLNNDRAENNNANTTRYKLLKAGAFENIASTMESKNYKNALEVYKKAFALEAETGDKKAIAHTYQWIGNMYNYTLKKPDEALNNYQLSLNFSRAAGDKAQEAQTYNLIADMYYASSNYLNTKKYYELAVSLWEETGNKYQQSYCYRWIAECQWLLHQYGDAAESGEKSLLISQQIKDTGLEIEALGEMTSIYYASNDYGQALKYCDMALNINQLRHDSSEMAKNYLNIGNLKALEEEYEAAMKYYLEALPILTRVNDYQNLIWTYHYLAVAYEQRGNYEKAIENDKTSLEYAKLYGYKKFIAMQYNSLGDSYLKASDVKNALTNYLECVKVSDTFNLHKQGAFGCLGIGGLWLSKGNYGQAITWLNKAASLVPPSEYFLLSQIYQKQSQAYEKSHDFQNAYLSEIKFKEFSDSNSAKEKREKLANLASQLEFENKRSLQKASQDKIISLRESEIGRQKLVRNVSLAGLAVLLVFASIFFIRYREKRKLNIALEKSLLDVKTAQSQLIQQEKLASLGELTAGIAHEIQNPLNFVNNFSEVSNELVDEMKAELAAGNSQLANEIADEIKQNLEKINHHGTRADSIVKGMLQHSRSGTGVKELTNINALANEYLRLAYHGLRAKDKNLNAELKTGFDASIGKTNIIPQDIGRVLLNLYNNAFYAVSEKKKLHPEGYEPAVSVSTKKLAGKFEIRVKDNGMGIPPQIVDKIFQPFFTTKPTGSGTGLGLSLSYDIIKAHGGKIKAETKEGEGSEFIIQLPDT